VYRSSFQFRLTVQDNNGEVLRREELKDFRPCLEEVLFSAVLSGEVPNDSKTPAVEIEPVGDTQSLTGFRVRLGGQARDFGVNTVLDRVLRITSEAKLSDEESERPSPQLSWWVDATPKQDPEGPRKLRATLSRQPYPISERPLADWGIEPGPGASRGLRVLVSSNLLEDLRQQTAGSLETERADLLAGYLLRESSEAAVVVLTGRIPADTDTTASKTHVSFSPLTFHAAQQQLSHRPEDAILGWHHNHPPPCGQLCLATVPACKTASVFFSVDDREVHRASFAAPFMVALVSGKGSGQRADDPIVRAYGWKDGVVEPIEYAVF
jgi:hypothetical protein